MSSCADYDGGTTLEAVPLVGHLDGRRSAEVREVVYDHLAQHPGEDLVLDLSQAESVDLTTMRLLAAAAIRVERAGGRVVLRGASATLRRTFTFGGWRRFFHVERA